MKASKLLLASVALAIAGTGINQAAATTACPNGGFTFGLGLNAIWPGYKIYHNKDVDDDVSKAAHGLDARTKVSRLILGAGLCFGYAVRIQDAYFVVTGNVLIPLGRAKKTLNRSDTADFQETAK
ncbi:MAG: hypothetical protein LBD43_00360 [Holosporales bacterium]|jgi:hypothetical protein|nr:hypothetical protein [Holosporales bacterium]